MMVAAATGEVVVVVAKAAAVSGLPATRGHPRAVGAPRSPEVGRQFSAAAAAAIVVGAGVGGLVGWAAPRRGHEAQLPWPGSGKTPHSRPLTTMRRPRGAGNDS